MALEDKTESGVLVVKSDFGGGWVIALNVAGARALFKFFGEKPSTLSAGFSVGQKGYVVEPYKSQELADHLRACNVTWEVG